MPKRTRWLVIFLATLILVVAAVAVWQRLKLRCTGFAGPSVTAADVPPATQKGNLRVVAWNVRNFPYDDRPQYPDLGYSRRTNVCDLKKVLAGLGADVLGLEEIRTPQRFERVLRSVEGKRQYRAVFTAGGGRWGQHVGIAWDNDKLHLAAKPVEIGEVALDDSLRPALAVYLRSTRDGGADFTVVQVHLRAGPRGFGTRLVQYKRLSAWVRGWVEKIGDDDVVVQGDFNTTGPVGGTVGEEMAAVDRILGGAGLRQLINARGCSEYWEGPGKPDGVQVPSLLDRVYVRGFDEIDPSVELESWLQCARDGCRPLISRPGQEDGTFWDVSDHCPLTFELRDRDLD